MSDPGDPPPGVTPSAWDRWLQRRHTSVPFDLPRRAEPPATGSPPSADPAPDVPATDVEPPAPAAERSGSLEDAIGIALAAHRGQTRPDGTPYILHPLRVMLATSDPGDRIAAVLHDVVEDSAITLEDLRAAGFDPEVVAAVDAVTRRPGESYEDFVGRAAANPRARRVKLADLADNMDVRGLPEFGPDNAARMTRYHRAWRRLGGADRTAG